MLGVTALLGYFAYRIALGQNTQTNCVMAAEEWNDAARLGYGQNIIDPGRNDRLAKVYAKFNVACPKGNILAVEQVPYAVRALANQPHMIEKAKADWEAQHDWLGFKRS
jgi:hypothetical protein